MDAFFILRTSRMKVAALVFSGERERAREGRENNALHNAPNVRPTKELVELIASGRENFTRREINTRKDRNALLRLGQHVCGSGEGWIPNPGEV